MNSGSDEQFYGGSAYGTGAVSTILVSAATETNTALPVQLFGVKFATPTGSITPAGSLTTLFIKHVKSVSGSITPTSLLDKEIDKRLIHSLLLQKNDTESYNDPTGVVQEFSSLNQPISLLALQSGLTKSVSKAFNANIPIAGSISLRKLNGRVHAGSITPAGSLTTAKYTKYYIGHPGAETPISSSVTPTSTLTTSLVDPSDLDYLVLANSQKIIPRVNAYWSNGKFTKNLVGFSSSDVYQEKTVSLNPVLYWKFDELSDTAFASLPFALDSGNNNYDGTYVGTKSRTIGALKGNDDGKYALTLAGAGHVRLTSSDKVNPVNNFQIESWIRIPSVPGSEVFVYSKGQGTANSDKQYGLSVKSDSSINAYVYAGSNQFTVASTSTMTTNTWYHVVLTVENQKLKLIVNGVEENSINVNANINVTSGPLELGRLSGVGNNFVGDIDEFAIYDSVKMTGSGGAYARYRSGINEGVSQWYTQFYPEQIMNGFTRVSYVWGVTDTNKLNGDLITANGETYVMESENSFRYEHGWWSRSTANAAGNMTFVESVVCEFDLHPCTQIDVFTSEFFAGVRDFDLYYKNSSDNWVKVNDTLVDPSNPSGPTVPITMEITDYLETISLGSLTYIKGLRLDILSVWGANEVARLEELDPTYVTDISEDIVSFNISTDREDFDSNIPIGSANANSISLELSNTNLDYSIYNINSVYQDFILPDVKFEVELGWQKEITAQGPVFEYVPLGIFWADEWQEASDNMTVSVNARDYSKFLQETTVVGNILLNTDGAEAIGNLLKETNYPVNDIVYDLPYDSTCIKNSVAGLWMLHEQEFTQYALTWNQEKIRQTAMGDIHNGPSGDFTLMFWVNTPGMGNERTILHFYKTSTNYLHITNTVSGISVDIGGSKVSTGVKIADSLWNQISISWNSTSGLLKIYKNGVLESTSTVGVGKILDGTNYTLSLGAQQTAKNRIYNEKDFSLKQFVGALANILLWDEELNATQASFVDDLGINEIAFREIRGLEKNLLLAFVGLNGKFEQATSPDYWLSQVYAQDHLRLINVVFNREGFMQHRDHGHLVNMLSYGAIDYAQDDSAFALEPFNKSALLNGDKPTSIYYDNVPVLAGINSASSYRLNITDDIDIYIQLSLPTLTPISEQILYSKYKTAGSVNQRSLKVSLRTTGALRLTYSTNGTSDTNVDSTVFLQNKDIRPNEKFWIRVSHDVDNGSSKNVVSFYISKEDVAAKDVTYWEPVSQVETAGALASGRYANTAGVYIGSDADANGRLSGTYIHAVYVTAGISSDDVRIDFDSDSFTSRFATSFTDKENNIWSRGVAVFSNEGGSYLMIPPSNSINIVNNSFSIALWAKPKANETYLLLSKDSQNTETNGAFAVYVTEDGRLGVVRKSGLRWDRSAPHTYGFGAVSTAGKVTANEWNFIVISYEHDNDNIDNRRLKTYINNQLISNIAFPGFVENSAPWLIGTDSYRRTFCGSGIYLNGLAFFDKTLAAADVQSLYRAGASLVNTRFPVIWTDEGETIWDSMLAVATADLGTFYFDYDGKFIYSNALNNYSPAFEEFAETQWYFDDDEDIVSASQTIALQANKIVVRLQSDGIDFNKREALWSAPDNSIISGGELQTALTSTFTEYIEYKTKIIGGEGVEPFTVPDFAPTGYVKINDEIIYYERKDARRLYNLKRGQFDTDAATHAVNDRVREVRYFNIEYSSKPALVTGDPFITAVIYNKTVDIDLWRPEAFGAKLVISRNETGDPYLQQVLASTDPLNNINNALDVAGIVFSNPQSQERDEYESADYADNIRRYGLKQIEITNRFIYSHYSAKKYADYFLLHFSEPVSLLDVVIMGNPMIHLGDRVTINTLGRMGIIAQDYWVESNNIQYSGGIEQQLRLRKVN